MVAAHGIRWKLTIWKTNPSCKLKRFYAYISDNIKEEIITHRYSKKEYEQNMDMFEQCKNHIDLKQKLYYDYFPVDNPILPIQTRKRLSINLEGNKNDVKVNGEDTAKNSSSDKEDRNRHKERMFDVYEHAHVQFLGEYKKWRKRINKGDSKLVEKIGNELEHTVEQPNGDLTERGRNAITEDVANGEKLINKDSGHAKMNEIFEKKKWVSPNHVTLIPSDSNITNTISPDLTRIYIDNSKYFNLEEKEKELKRMKLSQYCTNSAICSSRFAFKNLKKGILKVNDKIVYENINISINEDKIQLTNVGKKLLKNKITIIVNKPKYYLSLSTDNKTNKKLHVRNLIRNENKYIEEEHKCMSYFIYKNVNIEKINNLYVCGRLDANSSGLLIFTQNTLTSNNLLNKYKYQIEKEYIIKTHNEIKETHLKLLRENLFIDGKLIYKCLVQYVDNFTIKFILYQGFHKMIRKICLLSNIKIKSLHRTRIGGVCLKNLPLGKWRFLMPNEFFF
ncbi:RNA pseudouridylate synthase, putative [Plasmodium ovale wallikeri]|uniref:RNA pseudouridylate synthase, putative n=2 Tax=Plasmodium ovale TaxID=36330 RepID=A0A1C3L5K9_PLAOA|nr:RNA pseudouridylate synthase, putative [Plasmodium ovale wallikeri]SBT82610.1 RNA pseudouridylate synthase, putative [Plasmodium ovale]